MRAYAQRCKQKKPNQTQLAHMGEAPGCLGPTRRIKDVARPTKKAAISEVIQAQRSGTSIPIEELTAYPEAFSFESPQAQSHVSWAPRPKEDSLPSRASASSSKKTATPPSQPSKGSTIPFTHTPSVIKGAGKTTSSKHSQTSEETSF